jgi:hypothetical protein
MLFALGHRFSWLKQGVAKTEMNLAIGRPGSFFTIDRVTILILGPKLAGF